MENVSIEKIKRQYGVVDEEAIVENDDCEFSVEVSKNAE